MNPPAPRKPRPGIRQPLVTPVRLVIADDHAVVRQGIRSMLSGTEMSVIAEAADGLEAVRLTRTLLPDVLLLDIALPGQRGIAVLHTLRTAGLSVPVVFFSMYPASQYADYVRRAGAQGFVSKDAGRETLLACLRQVVASPVTRHCPAPPVTPDMPLSEAACTPLPEQVLLDSLSRREQEVLQAMLRGLSARAIAAQLGISDKSVGTYRRRLLDKLGLSGNAELFALAARHDLA